jgi:propanol-preferring alcohol dehydrogenase
MEIPEVMRAMVLERQREPLRKKTVQVPEPGPGQVLIRVHACGVCRTDLHIVDGELANPKLPLILGHEIVGRVVRRGSLSSRLSIGQRVGVPWLGYTDGRCRHCRRGRENLCDNALFTGYTLDGGYAEYAVAYEDYCFSLPPSSSDAEAAPLMCAGLIGYRSYRMATQEPGAERLGLYGFGAAAHIICQVAAAQGREVYAFTRPGDSAAQEFALRLGASWAGGSDQMPPKPLDAAIIFAPLGSLVPAALRATEKGGIVVCGGIHMSDIPSFPYSIIWEERRLQSVANLTRQDGIEFMKLASLVRSQVQTYCLEEANEALSDLRQGRLTGAAVLVVDADDTKRD